MEQGRGGGTKGMIRPITEIAARLGLLPDDLELYGGLKAKIRIEVLDRLEQQQRGKYVVVTAVTPTPLGEGKTTTAVGLAQGLSRIGSRAIVTLRQPSLGPVFGAKGGGAGGGKATLVPAGDLNLHFTGDAHAVTAAHNLCAAFLDNHLHFGNALDFDPSTITWRRVLDVNDRSLRSISIGQGDKSGPPRETGFDITAASEVMSILSLASDYADLRTRLGRIVAGVSTTGQAITAGDLGVAGGMTALLRDALKPNLVQTNEGAPAIVHTGPFGNVALGNSSLIADRLALGLADIVVTESGFASELGAEKCFDVKCRVGGLRPDAAVVVATIRALKAHSGRFKLAFGKPLPPEIEREDLDSLEDGLPNLVKHIENILAFGVPVVVAINGFPTDSPREVGRVIEVSRAAGAENAVVSNVFAQGGAGGEELARAVLGAAGRVSDFRYLYELDSSATEKIDRIATAMYGAGRVDYAPEAIAAIARAEALGFGQLPICMAKTPLSLSGDAALKGRPEGFTLTIRDVRLYAGAGYLVPLAGEVNLMPGLSRRPGGTDIDLLPDGTIVGLD